MKTQILEAIGETDINRSAQIAAALAANERIKFYISCLQRAVAQADRPESTAFSSLRDPAPDGVDTRIIATLIQSSRRENGRYRLPGCKQILDRITEELRTMASPFRSDTEQGFTTRLELLLKVLASADGDLIERSAIDEISRAGSGGSDSLHQLVMDMHKALNAMQVKLAEDVIDGAFTYDLELSDRPVIAAFMAGLNRTSILKFNHPGLGTIGTRAGGRLTIQNDLGTTDAHVVVLHIEGTRVHLIHTDIHPERIEFLRKMLSRYPVRWTSEENKSIHSLGSGTPFYVIEGTFDAEDEDRLLGFLEFLGSRLVFLIDWNRTRKELRSFLRGADRIALLSWAAEQEVGHRGFLELGGARLINRAIEDAAGSAIHFGDRLCDVLGDEAAREFMRFVFRAATEGLREHQSPGLIQDRVRAELQVHFSSEGKRLLQLASEQAAMIFEIAAIVQEGVRGIGDGDHGLRCPTLAKRARQFEHSADQLVVSGRDIVRRRPEYLPLFRLLETADNAADELEEVAFLMDLLVSSEPEGEILEELTSLVDILVQAAQEWIKAVSHGSRLEKSSRILGQEEIREFLTAVDALLVLEHRADDSERTLTYAAVQRAADFRQLHIYSKIADSLEEASDALKWAALMARDYLLGNVLST